MTRPPRGRLSWTTVALIAYAFGAVAITLEPDFAGWASFLLTLIVAVLLRSVPLFVEPPPWGHPFYRLAMSPRATELREDLLVGWLGIAAIASMTNLVWSLVVLAEPNANPVGAVGYAANGMLAGLVAVWSVVIREDLRSARDRGAPLVLAAAAVVLSGLKVSTDLVGGIRVPWLFVPALPIAAYAAYAVVRPAAEFYSLLRPSGVDSAFTPDVPSPEEVDQYRAVVHRRRRLAQRATKPLGISALSLLLGVALVFVAPEVGEVPALLPVAASIVGIAALGWVKWLYDVPRRSGELDAQEAAALYTDFVRGIEAVRIVSRSLRIAAVVGAGTAVLVLLIAQVAPQFRQVIVAAFAIPLLAIQIAEALRR